MEWVCTAVSGVGARRGLFIFVPESGTFLDVLIDTVKHFATEKILFVPTTHIFDNYDCNLVCLNCCNHILKAWAIKTSTTDPVIGIVYDVGKPKLGRVILKDFLLRANM